MYIDILQPPPADIPQRRHRLLRWSGLFLFCIFCALLVGGWRILFDSGRDALLENIALGLFVTAAFAFVYTTEKLLDFRGLSSEQQKKIDCLSGQHPEIERYCRRLATQGRALTVAEHEALAAWAETRLATGTNEAEEPR